MGSFPNFDYIIINDHANCCVSALFHHHFITITTFIITIITIFIITIITIIIVDIKKVMKFYILWSQPFEPQGNVRLEERREIQQASVNSEIHRT